MIKLKGKYYGIIPFQDYWFNDDIKTLNKLLNKKSNIFIYQSYINLQKNLKGVKKIEFNTGILSLKQDLEDILKSFSQTTRNEIKKIIRLTKGEDIFPFLGKENQINIKYISEFKNGLKDKDIIEFIKFYNDFALNKGLTLLNINIFKKYINNIIISKVTNNGKTILYHIYLIDKNSGILRLLYSASLFRTENKNTRKLIGWINNFQHFKDIEYGIKNGYKIYDFGGLYLGNPGNDNNLIQQQKITNFKLKFKPEIITQYNYIKEGFLYKTIKKIYTIIIK